MIDGPQTARLLFTAPRPRPRDRVGQNAIDRDGNGMIEVKELVSYLLKEFPLPVAHMLLRVLDTVCRAAHPACATCYLRRLSTWVGTMSNSVPFDLWHRLAVHVYHASLVVRARHVAQDQDQRISREEWARGWHSGKLAEALQEGHKRRAEAVSSGAEASRLAGRRDGRALELTAQVAAQQHNKRLPPMP